MRNPPQGARLEFHNLAVHRISYYDKVLPNGDKITTYRYDFRAIHSRDKFVYSGVYLGLKVGAIVDIKGTVKKPKDDYGYTRLSRVKVLPVRDKGFL